MDLSGIEYYIIEYVIKYDEIMELLFYYCYITH